MFRLIRTKKLGLAESACRPSFLLTNFRYSSNFAGIAGPQFACGRNAFTNFSCQLFPRCFLIATNPQIGNCITPITEIVQPIADQMFIKLINWFQNFLQIN